MTQLSLPSELGISLFASSATGTQMCTAFLAFFMGAGSVNTDPRAYIEALY